MKIEMHIHTSETSPCAQVNAAKVVAEHAAAGYEGIVITDHFNDDVVGVFPGKPEEQARRYLRGYEAAIEAAEKYGIQVFFGIEVRLNTGGWEDFLIYGAHPDFVLEFPKLYEMTQKEAYEICQKRGYLLLQAHPCRSYCNPRDPRYLDGVEIHNGNLRQENNNRKTREWAAEYPHFILSSGSDYHQSGDVGQGGIVTPYPVKNNRQLVECLKKGVEILTGSDE